MEVHVNSIAPERDAFGLQQVAHQRWGCEVHFAGKLAVSVHNAVARGVHVTRRAMQGVAHHSRGSFGSKILGNGSVGCHFPGGDAANNPINAAVEIILVHFHFSLAWKIGKFAMFDTLLASNQKRNDKETQPHQNRCGSSINRYKEQNV